MHKVTFTEKNGKCGTASFPTLVLATMYAKTVKGGKVVEGGSDEGKSVEVVKLGTKEEENARRADRMYAEMAERGAEAYMEAGCETMLLGGGSSEALDNANAARHNAMQKVCGCGKVLYGVVDCCYTCRRYR